MGNHVGGGHHLDSDVVGPVVAWLHEAQSAGAEIADQSRVVMSLGTMIIVGADA